MQTIPQLPPISKGTRRDYAVLVAKVFAAATYPNEVNRIEKAANIVQYEQITLEGPTAYVMAQCHTGVTYTVTESRCSCVHCTGPVCKHRIARRLERCVRKLMAQQWIAEHAETGHRGIATQIPPGEWVFQADASPVPRYTPEVALVLAGRCALMAGEEVAA